MMFIIGTTEHTHTMLEKPALSLIVPQRFYVHLQLAFKILDSYDKPLRTAVCQKAHLGLKQHQTVEKLSS